MTLGDKISKLRKENNYTQEQLADILGVSRQAISKWESNLTYPETDKLIKMSDLFECSLDYLLKDTVDSQGDRKGNSSDPSGTYIPIKKENHGRKSKKLLWGMPLWHVGKNARGFFALGLNAHGVIAVGLKAKGIISLGLLSIGILPVGFLSLGVFAFGMLSLGLISFGLIALGVISAGSFAAGILAAGAISFGVISMGALAVGDFSVGALAIGKYVAIGGSARAAIALGNTEAIGSVYQHIGQLSSQDAAFVKQLIDSNVPSYLAWAKEFIKLFI